MPACPNCGYVEKDSEVCLTCYAQLDMDDFTKKLYVKYLEDYDLIAEAKREFEASGTITF